MKKILMMFSVAGFLAVMALVGGCGGGGGGGGAANPTETKIEVSQPNVPPGFDASTAATPAVWFYVHPIATFTYDVAKFSTGDKLIFDAGSAIRLINTNATDGILDVVGSLSGRAVTIHLTGISAAADQAIFSGSSFNSNSAFGAGALAPTDAANINVTAANTAAYDASTAGVASNTEAQVRFEIDYVSVAPPSPQTYTYNVAKFAAGDKLVFDDGTAVSLWNTSTTDGLMDVVGSKDGKVVTIHLSGIAQASDAAISGVNSFNTVFGPGSLVSTSGDVIVQPAGENVSAANTAPGYDASTGAILFNVHPTATFTYIIDKFAAGDKLVFDAGTAIGLTNTSGTDGIIDITGSLNEQAATVRLTGIPAATDAAIFGVNSFNTVFGPGSLVAIQ